MPESIWVVLIPALSAAFVASVALLRQVLSDRENRRATETEKRLTDNDRLLREYRKLVEVHSKDAEQAMRDLARERAEHRETAEDRDRWRTVAARDAVRLEKYLREGR